MRGQGTVRVALAFAALLASLALVVSRQSRALEALRKLDAVRAARAVAESERSVLVTRVQTLESRARVIEVASGRLGMRVPAAGTEIVVLLRDVPRPQAAAAPSVASAAVADATAPEVVVIVPHTGTPVATTAGGPGRDGRSASRVIDEAGVTALAPGRVPIVRTRSGGDR